MTREDWVGPLTILPAVRVSPRPAHTSTASSIAAFLVTDFLFSLFVVLGMELSALFMPDKAVPLSCAKPRLPLCTKLLFWVANIFLSLSNKGQHASHPEVNQAQREFAEMLSIFYSGEGV